MQNLYCKTKTNCLLQLKYCDVMCVMTTSYNPAGQYIEDELQSEHDSQGGPIDAKMCLMPLNSRHEVTLICVQGKRISMCQCT